MFYLQTTAVRCVGGCGARRRGLTASSFAAGVFCEGWRPPRAGARLATMTMSRGARRQFLLSAAYGSLACVAGTLVPAPAWALVRGRVRPTRRAVDEDNGTWRVILTIRLNALPPTPRVTLKFSFIQRVDYERVESDGGVVERKRPVSPPVTLAEVQEVDFSDLSGAIGRDARAEIVLTRDREYRAGEYQLEVSSSDGTLGPRAELVLKGANPPRSQTSSTGASTRSRE